MPRSSSTRKKYVPKQKDALLFRFSDEDELKFQRLPHAQLCNLREGRGSKETLDMIEFRIRWCEHFAQKLGMQDVADQAGESVTALRTIHERYTAESRYNLTPDEAATLGESLLLADELQNQSTRRELRESLHSAMAYMRKAPLTSSATLAAH